MKSVTRRWNGRKEIQEIGLNKGGRREEAPDWKRRATHFNSPMNLQLRAVAIYINHQHFISSHGNCNTQSLTIKW